MLGATCGSLTGVNGIMLDGSNNVMNTLGPWPTASMAQAAFPPGFTMDLPESHLLIYTLQDRQPCTSARSDLSN